MNAVHNNRYADILTHSKGMERVLAGGGGGGGGMGGMQSSAHKGCFNFHNSYTIKPQGFHIQTVH